ncbi:Adenylate kinase 2 [Forsythia ovata]|uniref:adenylate kinase n=1 Tax=Forsythia ovata TaxID=205694 RepID=A0ABD1PW93_9LAMI
MFTSLCSGAIYLVAQVDPSPISLRTQDILYSEVLQRFLHFNLHVHARVLDRAVHCSLLGYGHLVGSSGGRRGLEGVVVFEVVASANKAEPLKVMISGAPASGKGTQCELIRRKYDFVHIAAGDLLRAEVAAGTENGRRAKECMEKGQLVPDEIVVMMVKERLLLPDSQEKGWLLDGYPRSSSQANALKEFGFQPDLFILLEVPEEILVDRVVGRRLDPVTGKIYHLKYSPPETQQIAARLTQRFDDTEEKVKLRLLTHNKNVEAVLSMYEDITVKVDGSLSKEDVFAQIDSALRALRKQGQTPLGSLAA